MHLVGEAGFGNTENQSPIESCLLGLIVLSAEQFVS